MGVEEDLPFISIKTIGVTAVVIVVYSASAFGILFSYFSELQKISPVARLEAELGLSAVSNVLLAADAALYSSLSVSIMALIYPIVQVKNPSHSKGLFLLFSFLVGVVALVELSTGYFMFDFVTRHKEAYCQDEGCNPVDTPFDTWQLETTHTELAIFNECCYANIDAYDAEQTTGLPLIGYADIQLKATRVQVGETQECFIDESSLNLSLTCDPVGSPGIIDTLSGLEEIAERLCTCIPNLSQGPANTRAKIQELGTCAALEAVAIPIDPDLVYVPSTLISFGFILSQYPWYSDFGKASVPSLPLIATPGIPLTATDNKGFGCGLGFGKGFMWYSDLFYETNLLLPSYVALGYGGSLAIFTALAGAYLYISMAGEDDDDDDDDRDSVLYSTGPPPQQETMMQKAKIHELLAAGYVEHFPESSSEIVASVKPKKKKRAEKLALPEPRRVSFDDEIGENLENKERNKEEVHLTREQLEAKMIRFYEKFEPSKLVNGRVDTSVLDFVMENGVSVFNQRLQEKYGNDLDHDIDKLF